MKVTHFCAGDKTQDKTKGKPFTRRFFFPPKAHLILLLCVHKVLNPLPPRSSWCWDAMATEAACDWQVTLAAQTWPLSETVTQAHWCQTCLSIQGTAYVGLTLHTGGHPVSAFWATEPANQGSVFCHLLSQCQVLRYLEATPRSQKPDVPYCQTTDRDKLANTCTRMPSVLLAFFDALQL